MSKDNSPKENELLKAEIERLKAENEMLVETHNYASLRKIIITMALCRFKWATKF